MNTILYIFAGIGIVFVACVIADGLAYVIQYWLLKKLFPKG